MEITSHIKKNIRDLKQIPVASPDTKSNFFTNKKKSLTLTANKLSKSLFLPPSINIAPPVTQLSSIIVFKKPTHSSIEKCPSTSINLF